MAVTCSSDLLAKLENISWCYSINTALQGINSTLLVKYVIEDNAYAIMVTDFSSTFFECLIGEQIEHHYTRFNNKAKHLPYQQILPYLAEMLQNLRVSSNLLLEKLEIDCHTSRITAKTTKQFNNLKINWSFYIISTEPEIFLKHFSLPVWRGLLHFYRLSQGQNSHANNTNAIKPEQNQNHTLELASPSNTSPTIANLLPFPFDDALLKEIFR